VYIRSHEGLGRGTRFVAMNYGLDTRAGFGMGQQLSQPFGPAAAENGLPFHLTDEQVKVVLGALRHAPGQETFFYIHADASGRDSTFKFGEGRAAPPEVIHQSDFNLDAANAEADRLTKKALRATGNSVVRYTPSGFGHTHPAADAGKPSGTDLGNLASIATATPMLLMVTATAAMPRPAAVGRSTTGAGSPSSKRRELDASVVWRSAYAHAPGGKLFIPRLGKPVPVNYSTHEQAADAAHRISPDLVFRYFRGRIIYENGQFSSQFVEIP
jgi:hypothetical protein